MKWLSNSLENTNLPTLVHIHHPLDEQSMENNYYFRERPAGSCVSNREEVRKVLEGSGKVIAIFSGHTHFFHEQIMNDIQYVTVPSFAENNGNHEPALQYAIAELDGKNVRTEIFELNRDS